MDNDHSQVVYVVTDEGMKFATQQNKLAPMPEAAMPRSFKSKPLMPAGFVSEGPMQAASGNNVNNTMPAAPVVRALRVT